MKTHETDLLSLIPGLIFVVLGVLGLGDWIDVDVVDARWVWPSLLIVLGVVVLATAGTGRRNDPSAVEHDEPAAVGHDEPSHGPDDRFDDDTV